MGSYPANEFRQLLTHDECVKNETRSGKKKLLRCAHWSLFLRTNLTVWGSFPAVEIFFIWGHTEQQKFGCVIGKHCSEEVERAEAQKPGSTNML